MNLGILGDATIDYLNPDYKIWVTEQLIEIYNKSKPKAIFTYDRLGVSILARYIAKDTTRVVLSQTNYNYYNPRFSDLTILDNDILPYVDYILIVSNGEQNEFYRKHRCGKVYEMNYLDKSGLWISYPEKC